MGCECSVRKGDVYPPPHIVRQDLDIGSIRRGLEFTGRVYWERRLGVKEI